MLARVHLVDPGRPASNGRFPGSPRSRRPG
jgi:hypothetical protein